MIKAIIFDIDGVLVDSKDANTAFFQNLLEKAGYPRPTKDNVTSCFHLPMWQTLEKLTGSKDQAEIKRIFDMAKDHELRERGLLNFPDKLEEMLDALHKKYKLAIVTSRIRDGIYYDIFSTKDIEKFFDVVVAFEDYTNPKPHPEPLEIAVKKLGLDAKEAVYIGDSSIDVDSANAAGMKSVYLSAKEHPGATARIEKLQELEQALEEIF